MVQPIRLPLFLPLALLGLGVLILSFKPPLLSEFWGDSPRAPAGVAAETKEHFVQGRSALRGTTLLGWTRIRKAALRLCPARPPKSSGGGDEGIRTPDLLNAIEALSQLSYIPTSDSSHLKRLNVRCTSAANPHPSAPLPTRAKREQSASPQQLAGEFGRVLPRGTAAGLPPGFCPALCEGWPTAPVHSFCTIVG